MRLARQADAQKSHCRRREEEFGSQARAETFGQSVTIDQIVALNPEAASVEGHANALSFKDLAAGLVEREPVVHKNEEDRTAALQQMIGSEEKVDVACSDVSDEIRLASKILDQGSGWRCHAGRRPTVASSAPTCS